MLPRKKLRKSEPNPSVQADDQVDPTDEQQDGHHSTDVAFLNLPVEIFDIIIEDLDMFTREDVIHRPSLISPERRCRLDVLRALSQTSRALRKALLPRAWEHFEACSAREEGAWYKQVTRRLEEGSKMLAMHPELAKHVRIISVALTRTSPDTVLPAFTRCLERLKNVHTLYILHVHSQMTTLLKGGFKDHSFPNIKTVVLPSCAHEVLRSCTGATCVIPNDASGSKLVSAIRARCPKIESLFNFFPGAAILKRICKAAPALREFGMPWRIRSSVNRTYIPMSPSDLRLLRTLRNLSTIRIDTVVGTEKEHKEHVDVLREVLQQSKTKEKKQIILEYHKFIQVEPPSDGHWVLKKTEVIDIQ